MVSSTNIIVGHEDKCYYLALENSVMKLRGMCIAYSFFDDTKCPISNIAKYLNQPEVQKLIGADPAVKNFSTASTIVNKAFMGRLDLVFPTQYYLTALLERGVRVLLYVGANDFACNWVRIRLAATTLLLTIRSLGWQRAYVARDGMDWARSICEATSRGVGCGRSRCWPRTQVQRIHIRNTLRCWPLGELDASVTIQVMLTFLQQVPYDKPIESLEMLKRWLYEDGL